MYSYGICRCNWHDHMGHMVWHMATGVGGVYTVQGLEGTTPLCVLAKGVPSFQWAALFENLVSRQVALPRAAWLIRVVYLNRHRSAISSFAVRSCCTSSTQILLFLYWGSGAMCRTRVRYTPGRHHPTSSIMCVATMWRVLHA